MFHQTTPRIATSFISRKSNGEIGYSPSPGSDRFSRLFCSASKLPTSRHLPLLNIIPAYDDCHFRCSGAKIVMERLKAILWDDDNSRWNGRYALIGLSGGKTPAKIYEIMNELSGQMEHSMIDFTKIVFFLIDERYVPPDHPDSNANMIRQTLFGPKSKFNESIVLFPDTTLPLEECVASYERHLKEVFIFSKPSICILGMGEDGHIASWFPPFTYEECSRAYDGNRYVWHVQQDKGFPVRDRITISMHLIQSSSQKIFFLNGEEKVNKFKDLVQHQDRLKEEPLLQIFRSHGISILSFPSLEKDEIQAMHEVWTESRACLAVIILGASGDLAIKKTFPALFSLYCGGFLPVHTRIIAYYRSNLSLFDLWIKIHSHLQPLDQASPEASVHLDGFRDIILSCRCRAYDDEFSAKELNNKLREMHESRYSACNRMFYLALPPNQFAGAVMTMKKSCWSSTGWNRVVVEKPFGKDSKSSAELTTQLAQHAREEELFRIDHYLGKEMVLNLFVVRFSNMFIAPLWNKLYIRAVRITFKETVGTYGRGGYFDNYGVIRDVMQNHLIQILSLIGMEKPISLDDEDIRDEKVKVLRCIQPPKLENTVIGQYTASESMKGYRDDPSVPPNSMCATFATTVLFIDNERWEDVPFILKAGKALETSVCEVRVQFRSVAGNLFKDKDVPDNELVIIIQPNSSIYLKCNGKKPGFGTDIVEAELDLSVMDRFKLSRLSDAYERLLLDVIRGDKKNFVRSDELREAWRIFTPLVDAVDRAELPLEYYTAGSRGPSSSDDLIRRHGFKRFEGYSWIA